MMARTAASCATSNFSTAMAAHGWGAGKGDVGVLNGDLAATLSASGIGTRTTWYPFARASFTSCVVVRSV